MSNLPAKANTTALVAFQADLKELQGALAVNIGTGGITEFDLPRIKIPAGGGTTWQVPTLEGDASETVLEGVILSARDGRSYYKDSIEKTGGGQPPDCASVDGVNGTPGTGENKGPGGLCASCPLGGFGGPCKPGKLLFIIRKGLLPDVVQLPRTSLKPVREYLLKLASNAVPYFHAITRIGLAKDKNPQGITYSKATFQFGGKLSDEEKKKAEALRNLYMPLIGTVKIDATPDPGEQAEPGSNG